MSHSIDLSVLPEVQGPLGAAPPRHLNSIRRTTSIDVTWPEGRDGVMRFDARGRDLVTGASLSDTHIARSDAYGATVGRDRTLLALDVTPAREFAHSLIGCRGGGHLRLALKEALPDDTRLSTPLYLLLDDVSGASLIAGWAWSRWIDFNANPPSDMRERPSMEGVCMGFRPGSSSLNPDGTNRFSDRAAPVVDLPDPADAIGWHALPSTREVSLRRSRRIDVWIDDMIHIDSMFQDSGTTPEGGRAALHEYHLAVTADPATGRVVDVRPTPRVLPFAECPGAVLNMHRVKGVPLDALREQIPLLLAKTDGCTHLNDALRALTSVPALVRELMEGRA